MQHGVMQHKCRCPVVSMAQICYNKDIGYKVKFKFMRYIRYEKCLCSTSMGAGARKEYA